MKQKTGADSVAESPDNWAWRKTRGILKRDIQQYGIQALMRQSIFKHQ